MSLYRVLLLAFPRRTRQDFGPDMEQMFRAQLDSARNQAERVALWCRAAGDAAVHGIRERLLGDTVLHAHHKPPARRRWWMQTILKDMRYALRMMAAQPATTAIAVLTLALGIGANTAMFSAVDAVLLRPLPYDEPDRLTMVWEKREAEGVLKNVAAEADFLDWRTMNTAFSSMAAFMPLTLDITGQGEPLRLEAGLASPGLFEVFGAEFAFGRGFLPDEELVGKHRVAVLSHELWTTKFGGNPGIVGTRLLVNGVPYEVVGVLSDRFRFTDETVSMWLPYVIRGTKNPLSRTSHSLQVFGRLKPGTSLESARADMDRVGALLSGLYPESNRTHGVWVTSLTEEVRGPVRTTLLLLLGAVGFVLLIACVNVANLLLARAAARRREIAVRAALGAGRARILVQALTESLMLGLIGGVAGVIVGYWGLALIEQIALASAAIPELNRIALDGRVLAFTLGLSLLTGLLFGTLPALQLARQDVNEHLKAGGRTGNPLRKRLRVGLVISEIALASLMLVGAGLTWRSFQTLLHADPGIRIEGALTAFVSLPQARYPTIERAKTTFADLETRLRSLPGVEAVGSINLLPLSGADGRRGVAIEGREANPDVPTRAHPRSVTPGYFQAMGMRLKAGRLFTADDTATAPPVVIVNETMAKRYWPDASAVGKRIGLSGTTEWIEVVGIVADVRHWGIERPVNPEMYFPHPQSYSPALTLVVRTSGDPAALGAAVREQLRLVDPDLPRSNIRTMEEVASESLESRAAVMRLLALFGCLALVLSAAGIYGVMAHLVALRTNEIGLRMTLGAKPSDVMRQILREGLVQSLIGLTLGIGGGVLLMNTFRSVLYEVSPADPLTLAGVSLVLLATALLACTIPARRAMRVDPATVMRL
jgi:predicted permease